MDRKEKNEIINAYVDDFFKSLVNYISLNKNISFTFFQQYIFKTNEKKIRLNEKKLYFKNIIYNY